MKDDHASLRRSKVVGLLFAAIFLCIPVLLPLAVNLFEQLSPETILRVGHRLPSFDTNLNFLLRTPEDIEGLAVTLAISWFITSFYFLATLFLIIAAISKKIRDECLLFFLVLKSVSEDEKGSFIRGDVFLIFAAGVNVLAGWNARVIFGAMHAHSNMTTRRVPLSAIQVAVHGCVIFFLIILVVGALTSRARYRD